MMKKLIAVWAVLFVVVFVGCGGGGSSTKDDLKSPKVLEGSFQGVSGVRYATSSGLSGYTDKNGTFDYKSGDEITFSVKNLVLGTLKAQEKIGVGSFSNPAMVAQALNALDSDANPDNGITIASSQTNNSPSLKASSAKQINLDAINNYVDYEAFIKQNGLNIQDKYTALTAQILRYIDPLVKDKAKKEKNYVGKIMTGHMFEPPFSRYAKDEVMKKKIKEYSTNVFEKSAYKYRVRNVTLYQMMLETIKAQAEKSKQIVDDSQRTREEGQLLVSDTMQILNTGFDVADELMGDANVVEIGKILAEHGADATIDHNVPGEIQPEAKLALHYIVNCSSAEKVNENLGDCAKESAVYLTKKYINTKLDEQDAVLANGAVDLAVNLVDTIKNCNAATIRKEPMKCIKTTTNATLGKLFETAMTVRDIYRLDDDLEKQNTQIIASDIFFTTMYAGLDGIVFVKTNPKDIYCQMGDLYDFDSQECIEHRDYKDPFAYFVDKVIKKIKSTSALTTNIFDNVKYSSLKDILDQIYALNGEYEKLYPINNAKLTKYKNLDKAGKRWRYEQVAMSQPKNIALVQEGNEVKLHACFSIEPKIGLKNLQPSLEVIAKNGEYKGSFKLQDFPKSANAYSEINFCGDVKLDDSVKDDTLLIKNALSFSFAKQDETESLDNFALYSIHFPKIPQKPVLKISAEYSKELQSYTFKSNLYDGENDPDYTYVWDIQSDDFDSKCALSKSGNEGYIFYGNASDSAIPSKCLEKTLTVRLSVAKSAEPLGKVQKIFSPLTIPTNQQPLAMSVDKDLIVVEAGDAVSFKVDLQGGDVKNYNLDVTCSNDWFKVVKKEGGKYVVTSKGVAQTDQKGIVKVLATDGQTSVEKQITLVQTAPKEPQKPLVATSFANKEPYSKYLWNGYPYNEYAQVAPNSTFTQTWWLQNASSKTLHDVTMKISPYCSSTLKHDKVDIYIGDLAPYAIAKPTLQINGGGKNGDEHYCQWDLYAKNDNGEEVRLLWQKSEKKASLNYYIKTVEQKDTAKPFVKSYSAVFKDGKIQGHFTIVQKNHQLKHLRVAIQPYAGYSSMVKTVDIGDYETLQSDGEKSFTFTVPSTWPSASAFVSVMAENKDGYKMDRYTKGLHLIGFVPARPLEIRLMSVEPSSAPKGSEFTFTVHLDRKLQKGEAVYLNFNVPDSTSWLKQSEPGGHVALSCSGEICSVTTVINGVGKRYVRAGLFVADKLRGDYSEVKSFTVTQPSTVDGKYDILAGKTFYTKDGETWKFGDDLRTLNVAGVEVALQPSTNGLKVVQEKTKYLVLQSHSDKYVVVQYLDVTDGGVILGQGKKYTLYFQNPSQSDVDVKTLFAGKTFYTVHYGKDECGAFASEGKVTFTNDMTSLTWNGLAGEDTGKTDTEKITVEGNKLVWPSDKSYTVVDSVEDDYIEVIDYESDNSIESKTRLYYDKTKADSFYKTKETSRDEECNEDEVKVGNLVSGYVDFSDYGYVPSDAWVGITPKKFQNDTSGWNRLTCKIDANGNFGNECYIDHDVDKLKEAIGDSSETFQIVVFKNTIEPDEHRWNGGEDVYKYVGSEEKHGSWSRIVVKKEDYQDRSDEGSNKESSFNLNGTYKSDALRSPNGNENWYWGENRALTWDNNKIGGSKVDCYVLHDNPAEILDALNRSDVSALQKAIMSAHWYKFITGALNSGNIGVDVSTLNGSGNAYMVLIISDNGTWDISDSTFSLISESSGENGSAGSNDSSDKVELEIGDMQASQGTYSDKIVVSWNDAKDANGYILYRCINTDEGSCSELASLSSTSYEDKKVLAKSKYYYRVKATNGDVKGSLSKYVVGWLSDDASLPIVGRPMATKGQYLDKIVVSWNPVENMQEGSNYELYRCRNENVDSCELIARTTKTSYEDEKRKGLLPNRRYYYRIKVQGVGNESGDFSDYDDGFLDADEPNAAPPSATMGDYGDGVKVSWPYVEDATYYELYGCTKFGLRSDNIESNGECRLVVRQKGYGDDGTIYNEAFDSNAKAGVKYWYYVRAKKGDTWGEFSRWSNAGYAGLSNPLKPNVSVVVLNDVNPELSILPVPPGEHGAKYYEVYRCSSEEDVDTCVFLQRVRPYVSVLDNKIARGVKYYYRAKSISYNGNASDFSAPVVGIVK